MVESNSKGSQKKSEGGCCGSKKKSNQHKRPTQPTGQDLPEIINNEDDVKTAKVIFMGDASVGKTSMIKTFLENRSILEKNRTNMVSDFCRLVQVEEDGRTHTVKLVIWDAAGDEKLDNLAHLFVRDVQIGVLVYSITSMRSFENI